MTCPEVTGRKAGQGLGGAGMLAECKAADNALAKIMSAPTVGIDVAATVLGIGRNLAYREAALGNIPTIRLGNQYRVPTARLREMLGIKTAAVAATSQVAA